MDKNILTYKLYNQKKKNLLCEGEGEIYGVAGRRCLLPVKKLVKRNEGPKVEDVYL